MRFLFISLIITLIIPYNSSAQRNDGAVIPGDFADPSIIRVNKNYFAVGTSSEWAPHFPIYCSSDLKKWKQVGYVFNQTPKWASGSFWAPEYFKIGKKYYVYYSARRQSDNLCFIGVATSDYPDKGFEDHGLILCYGKETIDPFIFNDNGQLYLTFKAYGLENRPIEIMGAKLSSDGLKVIGNPFTLIKDSDRKGMEGQSILKKDNYYYIFYSAGDCCGNGCSYNIGVARSNKFVGPYEFFAQNPILSENESWKCMGHGTFVNSPSGYNYYLHHAYNKHTSTFTGRQGLMSELTWPTSGGWPKFIPQRIINTESANTFDDFKSSKMSKFWQWDFRNSAPIIKQGKGILKLSGETKPGNNAGITLTTRPVGANFLMEVEVVNSNNALKGLSIYGDANAAIGLGVQGNQVVVWQVVDDKFSILTKEKVNEVESTKLMLRVTPDHLVQFEFRQGKGRWVKLASEISLKKITLEQWDRSPRPGLHYKGDKTKNAQFSSFSLVYDE